MPSSLYFVTEHCKENLPRHRRRAVVRVVRQIGSPHVIRYILPETPKVVSKCFASSDQFLFPSVEFYAAQRSEGF